MLLKLTFPLFLALTVCSSSGLAQEQTPVPARGGIGIPGAVAVDARCANAIKDQGDPTQCIEASSTATLGMLFPYPGFHNAFAGLSVVSGGYANQRMGAPRGLSTTSLQVGPIISHLATTISLASTTEVRTTPLPFKGAHRP